MPGKKGMKRRRSTPGTARALMWQSMRVMRRFTARDIAVTAEARLDNVYRYMRRLARHGYIRRVGPEAKGLPGVYSAWVLTRDDGPEHPIRCPRCGQALTARNCQEGS